MESDKVQYYIDILAYLSYFLNAFLFFLSWGREERFSYNHPSPYRDCVIIDNWLILGEKARGRHSFRIMRQWFFHRGGRILKPKHIN